MRYGSLFSGIEAATLAFKPLGWQCAWVSEIDPFCRAVLKYHYPDVPNLGDVTKVNWDAVEPVDLIIGGSPCQSFSIAGKRLGLDDPRGNLALVMLQIIGRVRPTWICYENVPGLLSSDEGRDFGAFLGLLGKLGYGFAYRVLDAQWSGVPQRRRRLFVIGHIGNDWRSPAAVLFNKESLLGHSPPSRASGERVARPVTPGSPGGSGYRNDADTADNLTTGTIDGHSGGADENDAKDGRLVVGSITAAGGTERKHGQGWGQREVESGLFIPVAFGGNNTTGSIDVATACRAKGGSGHGDFESETFIAMDLPVSFTGGASDILDLEDTAHAVTARKGDAGMIFDTTQITCKTNRSQPAPGNPSHPLTSTGHPPAIAQSVATHAGVRRLLPTETEALQGIPRDYTLVPYRGKSAMDGPRYKAIGNSFAVPEMAWIGRRIQAVQEILDDLPIPDGGELMG